LVISNIEKRSLRKIINNHGNLFKKMTGGEYKTIRFSQLGHESFRSKTQINEPSMKNEKNRHAARFEIFLE
jgi:uncharacterized protein YhaN